jgi:cytochrome c-type biogenesis protein CcmE
MKRSHILLLLLVAGIAGTFIATFTTATRSVGFVEASGAPGTEFKISGTLVREEPVLYAPEVDPSTTRFTMRDKSGAVCRVVLGKAKPTGLENSESIDLYGTMQGDEFHATEMLMKCPSKYNEQNHVLLEDGAAQGAK